MRICQGPFAATTLLFLGLIPQMASACIAGYWDHEVDEATSEIDAWAYVDDSFNVGYCAQLVYGWGYFEHSYSTYVSIESPTQEFEVSSNSGPDFPFGGGSAYTITTISFVDDPGEYIIHFLIGIWCTLGGDVLEMFEQSSEEVRTVPAAEVNECGAYADVWNAFVPRAAPIRALYQMAAVANTFSFGFVAQLFNNTPQEANDFSSGANAWSATSASCGSYTSVESITTTTGNDQEVDIVMVESIPAPVGHLRCGFAFYVGEFSAPRDTIQLVQAGKEAGCDNHRIETVYHEIGHLLGFLHIHPSPLLPISQADLYQDPRPSGPGPRVIKGHHLRVLVEKYGVF